MAKELTLKQELKELKELPHKPKFLNSLILVPKKIRMAKDKFLNSLILVPKIIRAIRVIRMAKRNGFN